MTDRKYESMPRHEGVYRILTLDRVSGKWGEPIRGAKFASSRYIRDVLGKSKKVRRQFETFAEAKAFRFGSTNAAVVEASCPKNAGLKFSELVKEWKEKWLPHKARSTQIRYESYTQHFDFFSDFVTDQIQPTDIDTWITQLKSAEYLKKYHGTRCDYRHEFSVLKLIFGFYSSRYDRNFRLPFLPEHRKMLKVKERPEVKKDLTVEQFRLFIQVLGETVLGTEWSVIYYLAMMQYAIYGRIQDVAALHFEDFNFFSNQVSINKKVVWLRRKGLEPIIEEGSKRGGGKVIPISDIAKRVFRDWTLQSGIRSGLLFPYRGKVLSYRQIEHRYTRALKNAGIPFRATHILRHASLTEFYDTCRDLLQTQRVAGHTSMRTTEKYAKVRDDQVVQSQLEMDKKFLHFLTPKPRGG